MSGRPATRASGRSSVWPNSSRTNEEVILEWNHRNSRAALELIHASAVDHFLIDDFEMSAALLEMLLDLDPEDHLEGSELLAFDYLAMDENGTFSTR